MIKYVYRFDFKNVKFSHHSAYFQYQQFPMANYVQRIKLDKGFSLLINDQGVTLMQNKPGFLSSSTSRPEKIQNFDSSLVNTRWVE